MRHARLAVFAAALLLAPAVLAAQDTPQAAPSPGQIVESAGPDEWVAIAPEDLLVMDLAPDAEGAPRRVVIQLMPPPFSQGWVGNIRKLAAAHWWDGTSINRVQDNYVVQWGDATEKKPLPGGLVVMPESGYEIAIDSNLEAALQARLAADETKLRAAFDQYNGQAKILSIRRAIPRDPYSDETLDFAGWPVAIDWESQTSWPVHCYGMVGVGRNLSPDTGTGAELYTVIGQAPRHLDRNIALVGRVVEGMENLSSLPRGKGDLGFYEDESKRVPILSVRLTSELPQSERPRFEYLSTEGKTFARYADARANRRDPFFIVPAGGADICNIPVPVRRADK